MRSEETDDKVGTWVNTMGRGAGLVIGTNMGSLIAVPTNQAWGYTFQGAPEDMPEVPTPDPVPAHLADLWAAFEAQRWLAEVRAEHRKLEREVVVLRECLRNVAVREETGPLSEAAVEEVLQSLRGASQAPAPMMATGLPPAAIEAGQGDVAASVDEDGCELSSYRDMIHRIDAAMECQAEALAKRGFKINEDDTTEVQVVKLVFWAAGQPLLADVRLGVLGAVAPVIRACADALELGGVVHADTGCAVAYAARKWMREANETASKGGDVPKHWGRW